MKMFGKKLEKYDREPKHVQKGEDDISYKPESSPEEETPKYAKDESIDLDKIRKSRQKKAQQTWNNLNQKSGI